MKKRHCRRRGLTVNGKHYETIADHSDLLAWFDYDKNKGIDPECVPIRSMERIWMKCPKCGHTVFVSPYGKLKKGDVRKCISCDLGWEVNNFDQRNSFGKVYPEFVQYWDSEKNKDTPFDVPAGSNKRRWFKCRVCGTSHKKVVHTFPKMVGCSKCVHQLRTSFGEQALFYYIQKHIPESVNGDRTTIAPLEIDILIPANVSPTGQTIAVEYCGSVWHERVYDKMFRKYEMCRKAGIRLLVVWEKKNSENVPDLDKCSDWHTSNDTTMFIDLMEKSIRDTCAEIGIFPDVDLRRDQGTIMQKMHTYRVRDSVADDPDMARLWISEKNPVDPGTVYKLSHKKFWFRCYTCGSEHYVPCESACKYHKCPNCNGNKRTEMWTPDRKTLLKTWHSARDASRELGISYDAILDACRGEYKYRDGGHIFHGYYWAYA